jgi:hypothetical protein
MSETKLDNPFYVVCCTKCNALMRGWYDGDPQGPHPSCGGTLRLVWRGKQHCEGEKWDTIVREMGPKVVTADAGNGWTLGVVSPPRATARDHLAIYNDSVVTVACGGFAVVDGYHKVTRGQGLDTILDTVDCVLCHRSGVYQAAMDKLNG